MESFFFSSSFQLVCCESQWRTLPACFGQPTSASLQFSLSQSMRSSHTYFKGWAADSLFALEAKFHMNKNNPEQSWDYPSCVSNFPIAGLLKLLRACVRPDPCIILRSLSEQHIDDAEFISLSPLICSSSIWEICCNFLLEVLAAAATVGVDVWSLDPAGHSHLAIRHNSLVEVQLSREFNA